MQSRYQSGEQAKGANSVGKSKIKHKTPNHQMHVFNGCSKAYELSSLPSEAAMFTFHLPDKASFT